MAYQDYSKTVNVSRPLKTLASSIEQYFCVLVHHSVPLNWPDSSNNKAGPKQTLNFDQYRNEDGNLR